MVLLPGLWSGAVAGVMTGESLADPLERNQCLDNLCWERRLPEMANTHAMRLLVKFRYENLEAFM